MLSQKSRSLSSSMTPMPASARSLHLIPHRVRKSTAICVPCRVTMTNMMPISAAEKGVGMHGGTS